MTNFTNIHKIKLNIMHTCKLGKNDPLPLRLLPLLIGDPAASVSTGANPPPVLKLTLFAVPKADLSGEEKTLFMEEEWGDLRDRRGTEKM